MAAYRQVYDSRHLQADYQEPGSAPEPYVRQSSIGYLFYFWLFTLSQKKTICNPLAHPTWKYTKLTCEVPNFFYLTEGLHCTCVFRTCVFHPCEMRCFVLAFSILAFSSTCVFSAPLIATPFARCGLFYSFANVSWSLCKLICIWASKTLGLRKIFVKLTWEIT